MLGFQCCGVAQWFCNIWRVRLFTLNPIHGLSIGQIQCGSFQFLVSPSLSWMLAGRRERGGGRLPAGTEIETLRSQPANLKELLPEGAGGWGGAAVKCKCATQALKTLLSQCRFTEVCFPGAWQPSWRQTGVLNPVKEPGWWQTWYPGFCWLPVQLQELLVSSLQGTLSGSERRSHTLC